VNNGGGEESPEDFLFEKIFSYFGTIALFAQKESFQILNCHTFCSRKYLWDFEVPHFLLQDNIFEIRGHIHIHRQVY